ncbi:uncharacterized protein atf7ip2 [Scomber japonicus]|uniref:uncharacterized protein atf7ip2 n=1 Tax=Scomber japonicus TaxID=13676 RepID=UPI00230641C6|nr:uncharacterized protein atf7ip2 [Scomber japonicus]
MARERAKNNAKRRKSKDSTKMLANKLRARVDIGVAFEKWRELKAEQGLKTDSEVALCLLDVMKRLPTNSTLSGDRDKKIKFSQSEVQTLIEQEVRSAVKKNEKKLQNVAEAIQRLNGEFDYETSMEKLEARVKLVTKRAEAVLANVAKTQKKTPLASDNVAVRRTHSQDETKEAASHIDKSTDCIGKSRDVLQMMETTKKALKKMRAHKVALTNAIADLSEDLPLPLPPHASPEITVHHRRIKKEPDDCHENGNKFKEFKQLKEPKSVRVKQECFSHDDSNSFKQTGLKQSPLPSHVTVTIERIQTQDETMETVSHTDKGTDCTYMNKDVFQENENKFKEFKQLKEPKSVCVKQECFSHDDSNSFKQTGLKQENEPKCEGVKQECVSPVDRNFLTDSELEEDEVAYPPLPTTTFPSIMNIEAASYNIPKRLLVHLALIKQPAGLSVLWNVEEEDPSGPPMDSYSIYITTEKVKGCGIFKEWKTLDEVRASPLPMYAWIPKYKPGYKMCVAVVGKDKFGRYGPYSEVVTAVIPE